MVRLLTAIGLAMAAVLIAASATMNYVFASSLGKTAFEGTILGAVSVAVDVLKALLAVFVAKALRGGQRGFVVIGSGAFLLFSIGSFVAASGFASSNRGAVTEARRAAAQVLVETEQDLVLAQRSRAALPNHRSAPIIETAIAALKVDARWNASRGCVAPLTTGQREVCAQVAALNIELATARERTRLDSLVAELRNRASVQRRLGGSDAADPQVRLLAQSLGLDEATVQRLLMSMLALIVEVSSALGIYLATGHARALRDPSDCEGPPDREADPAFELRELSPSSDREVAATSAPPDGPASVHPRPRASIALAKGRNPKPK